MKTRKCNDRPFSVAGLVGPPTPGAYRPPTRSFTFRKPTVGLSVAPSVVAWNMVTGFHSANYQTQTGHAVMLYTVEAV